MTKFFRQVLAADKVARSISNSSDPKCPKGKKYTQVDKAREKYVLAVRMIEALELQGKVLKAKDIASLTRVAGEVLECHSDLVRPLVQEFLNVLLDKPTVDLLAWQIAGNRKCVKEKEIHLFGNRQSEKCWMAGVILDVVAESSNKYKSVKNKYAKIKLIDGPGAGFIVYVKVPEHGLYRLSYILGNIRKGSDKRRKGMDNIRQCVLNHVLVYSNGNGKAYNVVEGAKYKRILRSTEPELVSWLRTTVKQKKLNKELYLTRLKPCVKKLQTTCYLCHHGYDGANSCFRGCRPKTLIMQEPASVNITLKGKNICQKSLEEV
jgi:hypothetical protein